jgi:hypothetical protein
VGPGAAGDVSTRVIVHTVARVGSLLPARSRTQARTVVVPTGSSSRMRSREFTARHVVWHAVPSIVPISPASHHSRRITGTVVVSWSGPTGIGPAVGAVRSTTIDQPRSVVQTPGATSVRTWKVCAPSLRPEVS